jgi:hypothetical protein
MFEAVSSGLGANFACSVGSRTASDQRCAAADFILSVHSLTAAVPITRAGVMTGDQGDKEIRFASVLDVVGFDRSGMANLIMSVKIRPAPAQRRIIRSAFQSARVSRGPLNSMRADWKQ